MTQVISSNPAPGASGVQIEYPFTAVVTFDGDLNTGSVNMTNVLIEDQDGVSVPHVVAYDATSKSVSITPSIPLAFSTLYYIHVTPAVLDSSGNPVAEYHESFTTSSTLQPYRINCGGPQVTLTDGRVFKADERFKPTPGVVGTTTPVPGTVDAALYTTFRVGPSSYTIPVPNGTYDIKVGMIEPTFNASNKRKFSLDAVADTPANPDFSNIDIFAEAGGKNKALIKTMPGAVIVDGAVNLRTLSAISDPIMCWIEVSQV